jgi:ABC-2 type transport system ATP-binding protein
VSHPPGASGVWGVERLTVRYGHRTALEDVTLAVPSRMVTAVVGGDGSGKSTLLRALAGAIRPAQGSVRRPETRRVGYVAGARGVYADLTVDENLAFVAAAYGVGREEREARAAPLLRRAGLAGARRRLAGQLSGGMRQKLAFILAALHEPLLLILDEPTTGVDPVSRAELWRLIAAAAAGGAAVVLSTTYLDEADRAAVVLVLQHGRALLAGPPAEVTGRLSGKLFDVPPAALPAAALPRSWRSGAVRRVWSPDGAPPAAAATAARPTLGDAVIVASLSTGASGFEAVG